MPKSYFLLSLNKSNNIRLQVASETFYWSIINTIPQIKR